MQYIFRAFIIFFILVLNIPFCLWLAYLLPLKKLRYYLHIITYYNYFALYNILKFFKGYLFCNNFKTPVQFKDLEEKIINNIYLIFSVKEHYNNIFRFWLEIISPEFKWILYWLDFLAKYNKKNYFFLLTFLLQSFISTSRKLN